MTNDLTTIALAVALGMILFAGIQVFWQWWQEATVRQRQALVREAARWTVEAAELLHAQPGAGAAKLAWVLERLTKRFPEYDEQTLARQVERAVQRLNAKQRLSADKAAHLNGKGPRHEQ